MKTHYTYQITHIPTQRYYIGSRSCEGLAKDDIGFKYISSSKDKEFKEDQRNNPHDYHYLVLRTFDTRKEATEHEIYLHAINDVDFNLKFINRAKATSTSFHYSPKGKATVKDSKGNFLQVSVDDPRIQSGEFVGVTKGNKGHAPWNKGLSGYKMPDDQGVKISQALKGKKHSPERILKNSKVHKGVIRTEASKKKQSETIKANGGSHNKGKSPSKETTDKQKQTFKDNGMGVMGKNPRALPVIVNDVEYDCKKRAYSTLGISKRTLQKRIADPNDHNYRLKE